MEDKLPDIPGDDSDSRNLSLPNITFGEPQGIPSSEKNQPVKKEPQPNSSSLHVSEPVQKASTSHDPESAIETTSQHPSSTSSSYVFNVPQPKATPKAATSSTSDSVLTSECTTTGPHLKSELKETRKKIAELKGQFLQAKDRNYHPDM